LKANWNFLKTVVKKLFEFMKETFEGVMEMSCNTFLKISQTCGHEFVINQKNNDNVNDHEPYIYELIRTLSDETSTLDDPNRLKFYEALGHIIRSEANFSRRE
jgi:exportin-1